MAEKVKVSRKVIVAFCGMANYYKQNKEIMAEKWINERHTWNGALKPLSEIDFDTLIGLLYGRYELTPEERVLEYYQAAQREQEKDAIKFVLETLDITIEGVNE